MRRGRLFEEVGFRPAYHDLLDNDRGYVEGAQIVFADAALRFYSSDRKLVLQKLDIIDIVSLSPRDTFFQPFSWKIKTGLLQQTGNDGQDHLVYQLNPGGGISYKLNKGNLLYFLGETDLSLRWRTGGEICRGNRRFGGSPQQPDRGLEGSSFREGDLLRSGGQAQRLGSGPPAEFYPEHEYQSAC